MNTIKNSIVILLAAIFFAFGSGITVCKMVCAESGDVQISLNEQGSCCDDEDDCCDENVCNTKMDCCTHVDNSIQLDNYIPSDKIFLSELNQYSNALHFSFTSELFSENNSLTISYKAPPPIQVDNFASFAHLLRI